MGMNKIMTDAIKIVNNYNESRGITETDDTIANRILKNFKNINYGVDASMLAALAIYDPANLIDNQTNTILFKTLAKAGDALIKGEEII